MKRSALLALLAAMCLMFFWRGTTARAAPPDADSAAFGHWVQPFLARYCLECHAGDAASADLRLDLFEHAPRQPAELQLWDKIAQRLRDGDMPPRRAAQHPEPEERERIIAWIEQARQQLPPAARDPGRVTLRRLNRYEYERCVHELLGVVLPLARDLPVDDAGYGFDTIGDVLSLPPMLLEKYLDAAERASAAALPVIQPLSSRFEAEDCERTVRGGLVGDFQVLVSNGEVEAQVVLPCAGDYLLRARAYGQQAGPELVEVALLVDGEPLLLHELAAERDEPAVIEGRFRLEAGRRQLAFAFRNDYFDPENEDPSQRDRNLAVDWLEIEGPLALPAPTASMQRLLRGVPEEPERWEEAARVVLSPLAVRAFRRPVREEELEQLVRLVLLAGEQQLPFLQGLQYAVQAILVSPHFLFKVERQPAAEDPQAIQPLDEYELATRLAFFLWSSLPDEALLAAAERGVLRAELGGQVERMLDDPRAFALVESFAAQWLGLRELDALRPDPQRFAGFDEALRAAMRQETEMFFEAVMRENRDVRDLLDADFSFVNGRLAEHYGIPGIEGARFRRVRLPDTRGGLLSQASILSLTSTATRTSPVLRGKWVLVSLWDAPPPPPPPEAGDLPEVEHGAEPLSVRERIERHRRDPVCASCHQLMDPLGFALESFDAIGAFRSNEDGQAIDTRGEYKGVPLDGAADLRRYLRSRGEDFVRCLARKLLIYALGRGLSADDLLAIDALVVRLAPHYRFAELIVALVQLDAFQLRRGEP